LLGVPNVGISLTKDVSVMLMNFCQDDYARKNQIFFPEVFKPKIVFPFFIPCDLFM